MQHAELLLRINASSLLPIRGRRAAVRTSFDAWASVCVVIAYITTSPANERLRVSYLLG